jgi:hypothetical protein
MTFLARGVCGKLAHRHHLGAALDELLDLETDLAQVDVEVLQHIRADSRAFLDEAEENVLRPDVLVVQALGLLVCQGHHLAGSVSESFEHAALLPKNLCPSRPLWRLARLGVLACWRGCNRERRPYAGRNGLDRTHSERLAWGDTVRME